MVRTEGHVNRLWRFLSLFCRIVWREIEPRSTGIPDEYRIKGRVTWRAAWEVSKGIHYGWPEEER